MSDPDDDHEQRPDDLGRPGEISPDNPDAVRGPNGIWNEETLPAREWEASEYRVVVPTHLQQSLSLPTPVLRWSKDKHDQVVAKHSRDIVVVLHLTFYLARWECHGRNQAARIEGSCSGMSTADGIPSPSVLFRGALTSSLYSEARTNDSCVSA